MMKRMTQNKLVKTNQETAFEEKAIILKKLMPTLRKTTASENLAYSVPTFQAIINQPATSIYWLNFKHRHLFLASSVWKTF
jgi:hypothetical protein